MSSEQHHSLRDDLARAEATLKETLDQACNTDLGDADTGELIRLEEVLAIANEAAKQAVSVRRRLSGKGSELSSELLGDGPPSREIEDGRGVRWLVFAVHPSAKTGRSVIREEYRSGWLAFDCGTETRRLAPCPTGWEHLRSDALLSLLANAEVARRG